MKIVLLSDGIPPEGKGGAERIAWQSAEMLRNAGNEVVVITTTRVRSAQTVETIIEGIKVFSITSNYHVRWRAWVSLYNPRPVQEVKRLLKDLKPDIVHAHNVHQYLSYASLTAARASGARVFHTTHDVMPFSYGKLTDLAELRSDICPERWNYKASPWRQFLEQRFRYNPFRNYVIRQTLKKVHIFAVSNALADALAQNGISDVEALYNGIDADAWNISPDIVAAFAKKHGLEDRKVILFGGRITGTKGGDAILEALPDIVREVPSALMLVLGEENEYVQKLLARAKDLRVDSNIRVMGWLSGDDLRAANHASHLVVVPSMCFDSLPTVALEAMACEKPVVGSCVGGIPEIIQEGETGYIVHPLATSLLAQRCTALLKDPVLAKRLGMNGAKRQANLFSKERHLRLLLEFYDGSNKFI